MCAQQAIAMSGKQQFPFMIDPNNNNRCGCHTHSKD